jgi:hypothetical protein
MPKRPKGNKAKPTSSIAKGSPPRRDVPKRRKTKQTSSRAKKRLNFDAKKKPPVGVGFSLLTGMQEVQSDDDEELLDEERLEAELGENVFKERLQQQKMEETPQRKSLQTTISRIKKDHNDLLGAPYDTTTIAKILKVQPGEGCYFPSLSAKVLSPSASQPVSFSASPMTEEMERPRQCIVLGCTYYNRAKSSKWRDERFKAISFASEQSVRVVTRGGKNKGAIHTFRNIHLVEAGIEDDELAAALVTASCVEALA